MCKPPVLVSDCVPEERDGELKSWIDRERFPNYSKIDSFTLYAMGDSGNPEPPAGEQWSWLADTVTEKDVERPV